MLLVATHQATARKLESRNFIIRFSNDGSASDWRNYTLSVIVAGGDVVILFILVITITKQVYRKVRRGVAGRR